MKTMNSSVVPKALRDVWEWKEAVYRETEEMTMSEVLAHIHRRTEAVRRASGLSVLGPAVGLASVAETRTDYGKS